jgi:hypothetical protein
VWVKVDDSIAHHPKLVAAGGQAAWHFICGLAYCARYLTDGFIPAAVAPHLSAQRGGRRLGNRLLAAGLWHEAPGGYRVHDYADYQIGRDEALALEAKKGNGRPPKSKPGANGVGPALVSAHDSNHESRHETDTERDAKSDSNRPLSSPESCTVNGAHASDSDPGIEPRLARARGVLDLDRVRPSDSLSPTPPSSPAPVVAATPENERERETRGDDLPAFPKPGQVERARIKARPLYPVITELFGRPVDADAWEKLDDQLDWFDEEGATAEDIRARYDNYPLVMPVGADGKTSTISLKALMTHWRTCAEPPRYIQQDDGVIRDEYGFRAAGAVAFAQRYSLTGTGFTRPGRGDGRTTDAAAPAGG